MVSVTLLRKKEFPPIIPYFLMVNDQTVGIMKGGQFTIHFPEGTYKLSVKMRFQLWKYKLDIGSDTTLRLEEASDKVLMITDREKWWNILFNIDLVLWLISFMVSFPEPWKQYYDLVSEGFFLIWIIRNILIRNRYFHLKEV